MPILAAAAAISAAAAGLSCGEKDEPAVTTPSVSVPTTPTIPTVPATPTTPTP